MPDSLFPPRSPALYMQQMGRALRPQQAALLYRDGVTSVWCPGLHKYLPLVDYLTIVKAAKARPDRRYPATFNNPTGGTGADILREWRAGIHARINRYGA